MTAQIITQAELKEQLHYNPDTGIFTRLIFRCNRHRAGTKVGSFSNKGYLRIELNNKGYQAHRLAWLYMTGEMPELHVDHINQVKDDNRWCNLRLATNSQNKMNSKIRPDNSTGFKGVYKAGSKFMAQARVNGVLHHLGTFNTSEIASMAYKKFAEKIHGEFYCAN